MFQDKALQEIQFQVKEKFMANNKINSRVLLKTDISENWGKAINFIPKEGEVCIYLDAFPVEDDFGNVLYYIPGIKVGDGETKVEDLYFINDGFISKTDIDNLFENP